MEDVKFDVSLVLALHREGTLLQRTLISLREAARYARIEGITIELVATMDRGDDLTRQIIQEFDSSEFDGWKILEVNHGSLGPSRTSGIRAARGEYIYICDGDDLISFNCFSVMLRLAQASGHRCVIFHQYEIHFGNFYWNNKFFSSDIITSFQFFEMNPYTSAAFAHRTVFGSIGYTNSSISTGYAYEDWHFNAECVARGYLMLVAADTILFYRKRSGSLLDQADNLTTRQLFPCSLFAPEHWVRVTRDAYERLAGYGGVRHGDPNGLGWSGALNSAPLAAYIRAANAIDPGVNPSRIERAPLGNNLGNSDIKAGLAYHEICRIIGSQCFDEVFLLPFVEQDGQGLVGQIMLMLYEMKPTARALVILGEARATVSQIEHVPPNATVIDLADDWPQLSIEQRELIALKLIQATAPRARLHLQHSNLWEGFYHRFRAILRSNPTVYYRLDDFREVEPKGGIAGPSPFTFISEHLTDLDLIVTDNQAAIDHDRARLGVFAHKWRYLPSRAHPHVMVAEAVVRAATWKGRVLLWAPQAERQRRVDLLPFIAENLQLLGCATQIDVVPVPPQDSSDVPHVTEFDSVMDDGDYGDFAGLDHAVYDALIYTAQAVTSVDRTPSIVLNAIAAGLPVIAPDIAGIGETIIAGETGLLLPLLPNSAEMAAVYASAITQLANDPILRAKIVAAALKRFFERHNPHTFIATAKSILGVTRGLNDSATNEAQHSARRSELSNSNGELAVTGNNRQAECCDVPPPHLSDLELLLERIEFLEDQIAWLRQASHEQRMRSVCRDTGSAQRLAERDHREAESIALSTALDERSAELAAAQNSIGSLERKLAASVEAYELQLNEVRARTAAIEKAPWRHIAARFRLHLNAVLRHPANSSKRKIYRSRHVARWPNHNALRDSSAAVEEKVVSFPSFLVAQVFDKLEPSVPVWLDGGWAVDALLQEQLREHLDLDLIIPMNFLSTVELRLEELGFLKNKEETLLPVRFVMNNSNGLEIDIHPVDFLPDGSAVHVNVDNNGNYYEYIYSSVGLMGIGKINGRSIRCTTAQEQVRQKLERRYSPWDEDRIRANGISADITDMNNLRNRFDLEVPDSYFNSSDGS